MDSKDTKSPPPKATHHEVSTNTDSTLNQLSGEPMHTRPGENIMKSDDPGTAALRYVLPAMLPRESLPWSESYGRYVPSHSSSFMSELSTLIIREVFLTQKHLQGLGRRQANAGSWLRRLFRNRSNVHGCGRCFRGTLVSP